MAKTKSSEKLDRAVLPRYNEAKMIEAMIQQIEAVRSLVDFYRANRGEDFEDDTELGYAYDCLTKAAEILEDELLSDSQLYALER